MGKLVKVAEIEEREIQRGGRVTIPKDWRDRHGLVEGTRIRIRDLGDRIEIEAPARLSSLYGLAETAEPCDDPKRKAREHVAEKLRRELE